MEMHGLLASQFLRFLQTPFYVGHVVQRMPSARPQALYPSCEPHLKQSPYPTQFAHERFSALGWHPWPVRLAEQYA